MTQRLLDTAHALHDAGIATIPVRGDGSKAPAVSWASYQTDPPGLPLLDLWFANGTYDGLGVITGPVSGQLELLEVEGRAVDLVPQLAALMTDSGLGEIWQRICTGWMERSPSGGLHWFYRVDGPAQPNTKLARRPGPDGKGVDVLIETRGTGGYVVTAPSGGRTHPTGEPWTILAGGPATIPVLTVDERDALFLACTTFDAMPAVDTAPATPRSTGSQGAGGRPGDDFNARATWDEILLPHGWTKGRGVGPNVAWTRPGKQPRDGISATTSDTGLYVFTTSTEFESEVPYSKFGAYALLEHHGDHAAAAKALRAQGYGAPLEEPRVVDVHELVGDDDTQPSSAGPPPAPPATVATVGSAPTSYTLTDDGNALRLIDAHAETIRYCPQRGQWLTWDTHRWVWDHAEHINELARGIARRLPNQHHAQQMHRAKSLSARGILAMVRLARSDVRTVAQVDQLDAHPYQLNTPGGVIDLRTGQLLAPDPAMLHTRSTKVTPQPGPAPKWERFLADTFAGDPDLTTYLQRILGQALIGQVLEQILPFAHGAGANGKTTLLGVVQRLVGIGDDGYSISSPAELLLATHQQGHPTEIARLAGARLVVTSELEDGQRFAEAKVKMLTGRDTISGRFMRQDWFSFTPTHTLFLLANHQPEVRAGGQAFWRRIALLPFLHTVPPEKRDPHLEDDLVAQEGPQILAWLIQGAVDYLRAGLAMPDSVKAATSSYETDQDTVGRFVVDCCETAAPGTQTYAVPSAEVRQAYEAWCRQEGEIAVAAKTLTTTLVARFGVVSTRTTNARMLDGVRLRADRDQASNASSDDAEKDRSWWDN